MLYLKMTGFAASVKLSRYTYEESLTESNTEQQPYNPNMICESSIHSVEADISTELCKEAKIPIDIAIANALEEEGKPETAIKKYEEADNSELDEGVAQDMMSDEFNSETIFSAASINALLQSSYSSGSYNPYNPNAQGSSNVMPDPTGKTDDKGDPIWIIIPPEPPEPQPDPK